MNSYMHRTLRYNDYLRKRDLQKSINKTEALSRYYRAASKIRNIIDPLCIGLCGTTIIEGSLEKARELNGNILFSEMERNQIFTNLLRQIGWLLIRLLKLLLDGAEAFLTNAMNVLTGFSTNGTVDSYITSLTPLLIIPIAVSVLTLGFTILFNSKDRPDTNKILQNFLIITIVILGMPTMMLTMGGWLQDFSESEIQVGSTADTILADNLVDYTYIYDFENARWDSNKVGSDNKTISNGKANAWKDGGGNGKIIDINMGEALEYYNSAANPDKPKNDKWDTKELNKLCYFSTVVEVTNQGFRCAHIDEPQWYEFMDPGYKYRYKFDFVSAMISLIAMTIAILFTGFKAVRLLYELAIYRVIGLFFAASDLNNGQRVKEVIKGIAGIYIVLAFNIISLKFFMILNTVITDNTTLDGLSKALITIAVAVAVIDGPALLQRLLGIDAGVRSAVSVIGGMVIAGKTVTAPASVARSVQNTTKEFEEARTDWKTNWTKKPNAYNQWEGGRERTEFSGSPNRRNYGGNSITAAREERNSNRSKPEDQPQHTNDQAGIQSATQGMTNDTQSDVTYNAPSDTMINENKETQNATQEMTNDTQSYVAYDASSGTMNSFEGDSDSAVVISETAELNSEQNVHNNESDNKDNAQGKTQDNAQSVYISNSDNQSISETLQSKDDNTSDKISMSERDNLSTSYSAKNQSPESKPSAQTSAFVSVDQNITGNKTDELSKPQANTGYGVTTSGAAKDQAIAQSYPQTHNPPAHWERPGEKAYTADSQGFTGQNNTTSGTAKDQAIAQSYPQTHDLPAHRERSEEEAYTAGSQGFTGQNNTVTEAGNYEVGNIKPGAGYSNMSEQTESSNERIMAEQAVSHHDISNESLDKSYDISDNYAVNVSETAADHNDASYDQSSMQGAVNAQSSNNFDHSANDRAEQRKNRENIFASMSGVNTNVSRNKIDNTRSIQSFNPGSKNNKK